MMKRLFIFVIVLGFFIPSLSWAAIIYLKNGQTVEGKIVDQTDYYVTIEKDKIPMKLYMENVQKIVKDEEFGSNALGIDIAQFKDISAVKANMIIALMQANGTVVKMQEQIKEAIDKSPLSDQIEVEKMFKLNELVANLVPVYDKFYSEEELSQLMAFYKSPVGQKLIEVTPKLVEETIKANIAYFKEKATQIK